MTSPEEEQAEDGAKGSLLGSTGKKGAETCQNGGLFLAKSEEEEEAISGHGKRLLRLVGPQLAVLLLLVLYLLFGAVAFRLLDPALADVPFSELVLFCFEMLATIGYGHVCPSSPGARLFTMAYSLPGIPLCMLTLANLGKHLTKAYGTLAKSVRHKKLTRPIGPSRLPLPVLLCLFLVCLLVSVLLFPAMFHSSSALSLLDHFYFSIISFTTVGFGDFFTSTEGKLLRLVAILCHLSLGMIVLGIWFQLARDFMQQRLFRFKQGRFRHARDIPVYFGRKQMRLSSVLETVAREFRASPAQIHQVLYDLDYLISDALDQTKNRSSTSEESTMGSQEKK